MAENREHALLSASAANQWLHCPASVRLTEHLPDTESDYAKKGTLAHALGELRLRKQYIKGMGPKKYGDAVKKLEADPLFEPGMHTAVGAYYDYVADVVHSYPAPPLVFVEQRVDYSHIAPEGFGTADCIILGSGRMHVIDYKNGAGVPVSAENNPQMKLYALGALRMFGMLYSINTCTLSIVQPNVSDEPIVWDISVDDLLAWGYEIKPIADEAYKGGGTCIPAPPDHPDGDWCRWCKIKATCRARAEQAVSQDFVPRDINLLSPAELADAIRRARALKAWLSDAEDYALAQVLEGKSIPGYKAVEGTSRRVIPDTDKLFELLTAEGIDRSLLYESNPVGLTALGKLVNKDRLEQLQAQGYIVKPQGSPALVPESDKRPPFVRSSAEQDFATPLQ